MNWGYKIAIAYTAFVVGILYMVYRTSIEKVDLMDDNYYAKELAFQEQINKMHNVKALGDDIVLSRNNEGVDVKFPEEIQPNMPSGKLVFKCMADQQKDFEVEISPDANGIQRIPMEKFTGKYYMVQGDWMAAGVSYYSEKELFLR
ncbi:MAG: FixH family protein [Flavobacteriales bacterium]|nr:FixH family protein [Flavobacteriales bacterium]MCB9447285.1 FixH family protein [Flavobacteriales bacterium]